MYFKHNESPEQGSRPMSASASGFVPGSGGAMVLEDYETLWPVEQPFMPKFWVEM
jgi:3-oxoacyl-(acyl-carrier-protein) synthase